MNAEMVVAKALPENVVYFNQWTAFYNDEIRKLFRRVKNMKLSELKKGEVIWFQSQQFFVHVYGFERGEVVSVEKNEHNLTIRYIDNFGQHRINVDYGGSSNRVYRCSNYKELRRLTKSFPDSINVPFAGSIYSEPDVWDTKNGISVFPVIPA